MEPINTTTTNTEILLDLAAMMATLERLPDGALWLVGVLGFTFIVATVYSIGKLLDRFFPSKLLKEDQKQRVDLYGDGNGNKGRVMGKLESIEKMISDDREQSRKDWDEQSTINREHAERIAFLEGKESAKFDALSAETKE